MNAKLIDLPSPFDKLLESIFSPFAKFLWMPSQFSKLLEMLLCGIGVLLVVLS
jgi:hypothetical protein